MFVSISATTATYFSPSDPKSVFFIASCLFMISIVACPSVLRIYSCPSVLWAPSETKSVLVSFPGTKFGAVFYSCPSKLGIGSCLKSLVGFASSY